MDNNIPSISQFLQEIDPNKNIDRKQIITDVTMVVLLEALAATQQKLTPDNQDKIKRIAESRNSDSLEKILKVLEDTGKKDDFILAINEKVNEVRVDYMRTHLEAMSEEKRNKIIDKFPALQRINKNI